MIGALAFHSDLQSDPRAAARALTGFDRRRPVLVVGHFDADGLPAIAILVRALSTAGWHVEPRICGKGETPWEPAFAATLGNPGGLVVADLGTRPEVILPDVPTVIIDHHLPTGTPAGAMTISGNGLMPEPTTALLAWWCAAALGEQDDLLWLAALGLIGDLADAAGFPELEVANKRWGKTALKDATSLVTAPRRIASADATPALALLLRGDGPRVVTKIPSPERDALVAAKAEVRDAVDAARRVAPKVRGDVAVIRFHSPCQVHPLIAQQWRGRLKDKIVLAANTGYREGWVHFAARSARGENLVDFLARHRPPGADSRYYGNGHAQATGGALRPADWNAFVASLGFADEQVPA